jgi:hypothetical protein
LNVDRDLFKQFDLRSYNVPNSINWTDAYASGFKNVENEKNEDRKQRFKTTLVALQTKLRDGASSARAQSPPPAMANIQSPSMAIPKSQSSIVENETTFTIWVANNMSIGEQPVTTIDEAKNRLRTYKQDITQFQAGIQIPERIIAKDLGLKFTGNPKKGDKVKQIKAAAVTIFNAAHSS